MQEINKCSICLDSICKETEFLPCCHFFHKTCIDTWLDKNITCPECRIPIFIQNAEQLASYNDYIKILINDLSSDLSNDVANLLFIQSNLFRSTSNGIDTVNVIKLANMIKKNITLITITIIEYDCDWIYDLANRLDLIDEEQILLLMTLILSLTILLCSLLFCYLS